MANLADLVTVNEHLQASGTAVSGYIESNVARRCDTCEYFQKGNLCNNKVVARDPKVKLDPASKLKKVQPVKGCCNEWEAK